MYVYTCTKQFGPQSRTFARLVAVFANDVQSFIYFNEQRETGAELKGVSQVWGHEFWSL